MATGTTALAQTSALAQTTAPAVRTAPASAARTAVLVDVTQSAAPVRSLISRTAAKPASGTSVRHLIRHKKKTRPAAPRTPRQIARVQLAQRGWGATQFSCLEPLWARESGWRVTAENPYSGAYGIPQAEPGSQMASAGADWQTSAATQIRWGLRYIKDRYGTPCGAWGHEEAYGWY